MLSSVEQAFVGRDEKRAHLKTPAWDPRSEGKRKLLELAGGASYRGFELPGFDCIG